jgi:hypothetical protein
VATTTDERILNLTIANNGCWRADLTNKWAPDHPSTLSAYGMLQQADIDRYQMSGDLPVTRYDLMNEDQARELVISGPMSNTTTPRGLIDTAYRFILIDRALPFWGGRSMSYMNEQDYQEMAAEQYGLITQTLAEYAAERGLEVAS